MGNEKPIMPFTRNRAKQIILLFILLFSVVSCSPKNRSPDDTLVTILSAPVTSLDPLTATEANAQRVNQLIHVSLLAIGRDLTPQPSLAESFRVVSDQIIEFKLRSGCYFQNGKAIDLDDVAKSIELYSKPEHGSLFQESFRKITRFEKIDESRFRLHTKEPYPSLFYDLALLKVMPAGLHTSKVFQTSPIGGGPYRLVSISASGIKLERFDNKCMPQAFMPKIEAKVVRDDLSRLLKLRNGEVDLVMNDIDLRKIKAIQEGNSPGLRALVEDGTAASYMGLNFANPHLKKINVRRAIALSLDINAIIRYKLAGLATPTATVIAPSSYYHADIPPPARDLEEARRLLDIEGYGNGVNGKPPLRLTLKTTTYRPVAENARAISAQLAEAGIIVDHKAFEWGTFYADVRARNTEMFLLRWVGVAAPDLLYDIFHSSRLSANNRTNYVNPKMDALLNATSGTLNIDIRRRNFIEAQRLAAEDLPYVNLWIHKNVVAYREDIEGIELLPTDDWDNFPKIRKIRPKHAEVRP
jgi:peptide/nickel transport system substrate-binding protein